MKKNNLITRRESLLVCLSGVCVTATAGLLSLMGRKVHRLEEKCEILEWWKDSVYSDLVRACWVRWSPSKNYSPCMDEIGQWVETIIENDMILKDPILYCAMIDNESSGDPTVFVKKENARGLGSIKYGTAKDLVERYKLPVKHVGTALWNPIFNIKVMIKEIEHLLARSDKKNKLRYALLCYNQGENKYRRKKKRGIEIDEQYYNRIMLRVRIIKKLMKG